MREVPAISTANAFSANVHDKSAATVVASGHFRGRHAFQASLFAQRLATKLIASNKRRFLTASASLPSGCIPYVKRCGAPFELARRGSIRTSVCLPRIFANFLIQVEAEKGP